MDESAPIKNSILQVNPELRQQDILSDSPKMRSSDKTPSPVEDSVKKNPLLNSLVIERILHYACLKDLKIYRSVCQEWNSTAESLLRRRSKIIFKATERGPFEFLNVMEDSTSDLPFLHFMFSNDCTPNQLDEFFAKCGQNIKSLKFDGVNVLEEKEVDQKPEPVQYIPTPQWFVQCNNLRELHMDCKNGGRHFILSEQLISIKSLKLKGCVLLVNKEVKISPVSLSLVDITFLFNLEENPKEFLLNDAFEFQDVKEVCIVNLLISLPKPLILDVGKENPQIERMTLNLVKIVNWNKSKWNVDYLHLEKISIREKITMGIKELAIYNFHSSLLFPRGFCYPHNVIDLSMLPFETLESLTFENDIQTEYICTNEVYLPNLKILTIKKNPCSDRNEQLVSHFTNCPNLVSITLTGSGFPAHILDVKFLPKSIKKLQLDDVSNVIGLTDSENIFRVNTLVLMESVFLFLKYILENIQADVVVVCSSDRNTDCYYSWRHDIEKIEKGCSQGTKIYVSCFIIPTTNEVQEYGGILPACPDNGAFFSLFQNDVSREITREEFDTVTRI